MSLTRRSSIKKSSYSAAAVTAFGTGVGLGEELSSALVEKNRRVKYTIEIPKTDGNGNLVRIPVSENISTQFKRGVGLEWSVPSLIGQTVADPSTGEAGWSATEIDFEVVSTQWVPFSHQVDHYSVIYPISITEGWSENDPNIDVYIVVIEYYIDWKLW